MSDATGADAPDGFGEATGWPLARLGSLFRHIDERSTTGSELLLSITKGRGVVPRDTITDRPARADTLIGYKRCKRFDLVINQMSVYDGLLGVSDWDGIVTYHYLVFRATRRVDPRYYAYLLTSRPYRADFSVRVRGLGGSTQANVRTPHIRISDVERTIVPVPPFEAQQAMANYLDAETARIDALIGKKQQMIRELHARRESVIVAELAPAVDLASLIVGHGTDLSLGRDVVALKRCLKRAVPGGTPDTDNLTYWCDTDAGDAVPWVAIGDMQDRGVTVQTLKAVTREGIAAARLATGEPGTLLFAMYASLGKLTVIERSMTWNQAILGLTPRAEMLSSRFLAYWLEIIRVHLSGLARSNTQDNLNAEQVGALPVLLPPLEVQVAIVGRLDETLETQSRLQAKLERQINLLMEHREALTTVAVTGELDLGEAA